MNDQQITTLQQLDAALAAQRADKVASLQRQANTIGYQVWVGLSFLVLAVGLVFAAYYYDGHLSPLPYLGGMFAGGGSVLGADAARRRRARRELEKELRFQAQQSPDSSLERSRVG